MGPCATDGKRTDRHFQGMKKCALGCLSGHHHQLWVCRKTSLLVSHIQTVPYLKIYLLISRERRREGEREGEKHWPVASRTHPNQGPNPQPSCALTGNWTSDLSLSGMMPNQLSHTSQGDCTLFKSELSSSMQGLFDSEDDEELHLWLSLLMRCLYSSCLYYSCHLLPKSTDCGLEKYAQ